MASRKDLPEKDCVTCGRPFQWRKKWEKNWASVRYCSRACKRGVTSTDKRIECAVMDLLEKSPKGSSLCPSEVARKMNPESWRDLVEPARRAARRLASRGLVEITQGGKPIEQLNFKGVIHLRLKS
ncbi:MAG: DUF2256 and DUF3253 domain-containing protein [Deltaproteobacteria bacterium]|jgi:hypothetical protein|nr:DUF2256 and DUF3253 domain-containing protein [Deltaproteobacteria bacterium]MBT6433585.1 DUF2256 and DUF3253 domain-containing protein [Deltaproteobacteria bacterium]MBT6490521.1 DUF2256 and DUF3253 domain-containing protein [Deltaproteobacteria bacterium]